MAFHPTPNTPKSVTCINPILYHVLLPPPFIYRLDWTVPASQALLQSQLMTPNGRERLVAVTERRENCHPAPPPVRTQVDTPPLL
ncbi:unnamed protein product [Diplocarpon coronariae]